MPIYEYRCSVCGFQEEYLQKVGEAPLTQCPECGQSSFSKLLSAAGFQLKGSGWYATDFKSKPGSEAKKDPSKPEPEAKKDQSKPESETKKAESKPSGSNPPAGKGTGAAPACSSP